MWQDGRNRKWEGNRALREFTLDEGEGSELVTIRGARVRPEWIDYNGHMNVAYYVLAFDLAVDEVFTLIGLTEAYREKSGRSIFAIESHVTWQRELHLDDPLRMTAQFLGFDGKRMHSIYHMYHAETGVLAATSEWLQMSVDMAARRSAPFEPALAERIAALVARHRDLPRPPEVGRVMAVKTGGG